MMFLSLLLFVLNLGLPAANEPETSIMAAVHYSIYSDYDKAFFLLNKTRLAFPDNPAVWFFLAATRQSQMMDTESTRQRLEFYHDIEKAVTTAKTQYQQDYQDLDALFFWGAALSYKSYQLGREKKYLASVQVGLKSLGILKKIVNTDSTFYDCYLGIGSYLYWRSQITKKLTWLPFFSDQRKEGIQYVKRAFENGTWTKWAALNTLAWIYIEEKQFDRAIACAQQGLDRFPGSRFFLWPLGDARLGSKNYHAAIPTYKNLLKSVKTTDGNNHYNEILLHLKICQCWAGLNDNKRAAEWARAGLVIVPDKSVKNRVKKFQKQLEKYLESQ